MNTNTHDHQEATQQSWTTLEATPAELPNADTSAGIKRRHGAHMWLMMLVCLPMVGLGIWSFASGANPRGLVSGLLCMGMMAVMHFVMSRGKGHSH